ncbi:MAG: hypothetical protein PWQ14_740 [Rikenellaceae bacterium]|nr:hypothetical protein [Rikenellaceae bacterium]
MQKIGFSIVILSLFCNLFTLEAQTNQDVLGQTGDRLNTITTAVPFLLIAPDARSGAMGEVGAATPPDINSMHWNPAKYIFIDGDYGVTISYTPWMRKLINDINLAYVSGYYKFDKNQAIAASLRYFTLGEIQFVGMTPDENLGTFSPTEFSIDVAYNRIFGDNFSFAIALRYIYSNLSGGTPVGTGHAETKPGQSVAGDVAIFYKHDFKINKRDSRIAFGMDISNLGARITYSELGYRAFLPTNIRIGPSFTYNIDDFNAITVAFDLNKLLVPTPPLYTYDSITEEYVIAKGMDPDRSVVNALFTSFWDAPGGFKEELHEVIFSGGIEYDYSRQFFVRAGYFNEHKTKGNRKFATFGVGVRYNIFDLSFSYLVPFEQHHPLENVLRFTMTFNFFKPQNKPK